MNFYSSQADSNNILVYYDYLIINILLFILYTWTQKESCLAKSLLGVMVDRSNKQ